MTDVAELGILRSQFEAMPLSGYGYVAHEAGTGRHRAMSNRAFSDPNMALGRST
jgi:hypothetical protein